jgi:hypothetical protein
MEKDSGMQNLIDLTERFLPLNKWNFKRSSQFVGATYFWVAVYDSKRCRIKIEYEAVPGRDYERHFSVFYGRLEVPDNASVLLGEPEQGSYNLLWHNVRLPLHFLNGLSPREAKMEKYPRLIREFEQSDVVKNAHKPENNLVMHAQIWEIYGQRLFDIFDARNTDLWERYCAFVKEYWEIFLQF